MTRFSASFFCGLACSVTIACGGTAYSTEDQGTGGTTGTGGAVGSGGSATGGTAAGGSAAGGSTSTTVHASSFDQSCEYDSQCTPVFEGNVCSCSSCPNAAISSTDIDAYNASKNAIQCPQTDVYCDLAPCQATVGSCQAGQCTLRQAVFIDDQLLGTQGCDNDSECSAIPAGELCSECQCAFVAVNANGKSQYQTLLEEAKCSKGPSVCDCAGVSQVVCDKSNGTGVCTIAR